MSVGTEAAAVVDLERIEDDLLRFITDEVAVVGRDVSTEENLIATGTIDSLGLLHILTFIDSRYGVDLMSVGSPRDFESVAALALAIRRERGGAARAVGA
jgi:hypothetical protein